MSGRGSHPTDRRPRPELLVPVVLAVVIGVGLVTLLASRPELRVSGPPDEAVVGSAGLAGLAFRVTATTPEAVRLRLDDRPVPATRDGAGLVYRPGRLPEGRHRLTVRVPGRLPGTGRTKHRNFTVDTTPPRLRVDGQPPASALRQPVTVTGATAGAQRLTADGRPVPIERDRFTLRLPAPPVGLRLVATDSARNTAEATVTVAARHPSTRGVHLSGVAWASPQLREPVLALARARKINAVQLDVKEEDGFVNYASSVPLAGQSGAIRRTYDPKQAIAELHGLGLRVVGRVVAFRDPVLGAWAWRTGRRDWVAQTPAGTPYSSGYGPIGFTNFAHPAVRGYNLAIGEEAARLGFDDVMYDYVRRPDGPLAQMRFPGIRHRPEQEIATFVRDARAGVRRHGAYLGAAVFGIAATRPDEVAQHVPTLARHVDYVAPMVYPSHWGPGEYGVADPNAEPYQIVLRSLRDFQAGVRGSGAEVVPWLQDFSLGLTYTAAQVSDQVRATRHNRIDSFLLWDAACSYTADALPVLGSG